MTNKLTPFLTALFYENHGETKVQRTISYLTWIAMAVTVIGSILSALGICTGGCTDAEKYRFFGMPFAALGIPFFMLLAVASFGRNSKRSIFRSLYDVLLPGVAGAEWIFIGLQNRIIKHYCPVCVAIAIAVFVAVALRLVEVYIRRRSHVEPGRKGIKYAAKSFAKTILVIGSMYVGLVLALVGISSPVAAGSGVITHDIWLGQKDSNAEVLIVSDWFCPYCRKVEPVIESMLPEIGKVARYTFIDDPIHPQSYNFIPAHMSLLLNSKDKYLQGRRALLEVAERNKTPNDAEIAEALKRQGIDFTLANSEDLKKLAKSEAGFLQANSITLTPTVVVRNNKTGAHKMLVGSEEITREKVAALITELGNRPK